MFSFFTSFGASSNFQKYRLKLTNKNYDAPDQTSLKKIIQTFRGEDQQTRSQIAFATIIKKLHTSDSNDNWVYLLKNLIIIDRVVEENCFLQQIASLNLKPIESYHQQNETAKALNSQNILKSYWKLIQYKSSLLSKSSSSVNYSQLSSSQKRESKVSNILSPSSKTRKSQKSNYGGNQSSTSDTQRSILSVLRSQKQQFLKTLTIQQIYKQSMQLQLLFENIFKVIASIEPKISRLRYKRSGDSGELLQRKMTYKSLKDAQNSAASRNRLREQQSGLSQNLLPFQSTLEVLQPNPVYNQKYKSARDQFFTSKLINYLHLQLLYKLLSAYSNQLICIRTFVAHLIQQNNPTGSSKPITSTKDIKKQMLISEKEIILWRRVVVNYLNFAEKIVNYVEPHKTIKGFEIINYQQLKPFQNSNILAVLDQYIKHKNTLQEPDIVKVEDLGVIIDMNDKIKVQKKAQWSQKKNLTKRKMVVPSRNLKDNNNAFHNWHNSYSSNFPPKQVLTIDLLMQIRQNPQNPATQMSFADDDDQSIYQPFSVNRHSCVFNYRQSNITASSEFEFIPLDKMQKQQSDKVETSMSKKDKTFYYFKTDEKDKGFKNIYSSLSTQSSEWAK